MINVEVYKSSNESTSGLIRRFSRRCQEANVTRRAREHRYYQRELSDQMQKAAALKRQRRRDYFTELAKLGKIPEKKHGRKR